MMHVVNEGGDERVIIEMPKEFRIEDKDMLLASLHSILAIVVSNDETKEVVNADHMYLGFMLLKALYDE